MLLSEQLQKFTLIVNFVGWISHADFFSLSLLTLSAAVKYFFFYSFDDLFFYLLIYHFLHIREISTKVKTDDF